MFKEKEFIKFLSLEFKAQEQAGGDIDFDRIKSEIKIMMSHEGMLKSIFDLYSKRVKGEKNNVNSYIAYKLGVTTKEPDGEFTPRLKFDLARVSHPDIDIDFDFNFRDDIYQYLIDKYGRDRTANIGTYQTLQAKSAIKRTVKAFDPCKDKVETLRLSEQIAGLVPGGDPDMTLEKAFDAEPQLGKWQSKLKNIFDVCFATEGLCWNHSFHAAGIVISDVPMAEIAPLHKLNGDKGYSSQFEMVELEDLGLIKFDILALKTLSIFRLVLKDLKNDLDITLDLDNISMSDKKTLELIRQGKTVAVFQLERDGMRKLLKDIEVDSFHDVAATSALYRPGALAAGAHDLYCDGKHGRVSISYDHPCLKPILEDTYGQLIYQEQCQLIAIKLADFTIKEADLLRKAIGKKKGDIFKKLKDQFISGAIKKIPSHKAESLWTKLEDMGGYAFNKSHAYAYSMISMQCAYLKAHYPLYYMKNVMNVEVTDGKLDKVEVLLKECKFMNIKVLPVNVNYSKSEFSIEGKTLRMALSGIKGIGVKAALEIENLAPYKTFDRFVEKTLKISVVNKATIEALIFEGAFCDFDIYGQDGVDEYYKVKKNVEYMKNRKIQRTDMFNSFDDVSF